MRRGLSDRCGRKEEMLQDDFGFLPLGSERTWGSHEEEQVVGKDKPT